MKTSRFTATLTASVMALTVCAGVVGCNNNPDDENNNRVPPVEQVSIIIDKAPDIIRKGETATLHATVYNAENQDYTWSVSDQTVLAVSNNTLSVVAENISADVQVSLTATAAADSNATSTVSITVKPPIAGAVGDLTADVFQVIANPSITVTGTLEDIYEDNVNSRNDYTDEYSFTVKMEADRWAGSWNAALYPENVTSDVYVKGELDSSVGKHYLAREYVTKDNEPGAKVEKDYLSIPAYWEDMVYRNTLADIGTNITGKFTHDASEPEIYSYKLDENDKADIQRMANLALGLTPILGAGEYFTELDLIVKNGAVTGLQAKTLSHFINPEYNMAGAMVDWEAEMYSIVHIEFSDIGKTTVPAPAKYEAPEHADLLKSAIDEMKAAKNYTFNAVETTTYMPDANGDDMAMESGGIGHGATFVTTPYYDTTSSRGTVGLTGWVTEEGIVLEETKEYSDYDAGSNPYFMEYTGYKPFNGYFERFKFDSSVMALHGQERIAGDMYSVMPAFEFSENVFEFKRTSEVTITSGRVTTKKTVYIFEVRDSSITRDLAMQISAHSYADDAEISSTTRFSLAITTDGHLYSATFPYALTSDQSGYILTTFSDLGTTELEAGWDEDYVAREYRTSWDMFVSKDTDFDPNHTDRTSEQQDDAPVDTVFKFVFGDDYASKLPTPELLMEVFGDKLYGPWFKWNLVGTDADGNNQYRDYITVNTEAPVYDENSKIDLKDWNALVARLTQKLAAIGYEYDAATSASKSAGTSPSSSRYAVYNSDAATIVFESYARTKNIFIAIYKAGEYLI